MHHLDEQSQQAVRSFVFRLSALSTYMSGATVLGFVSSTDLCMHLSTAFSALATLDIVGAVWRHEKAGRGCLNHWDTALAFNGAALLTHVLQNLQP